jgi:uncharacterized MAPEG superfamily protein
MTFAFLCVLIASFLSIVWAGYAKMSSGFSIKDNASPRNFMETLKGRGQRANWAQQNSWEAFAPFAAAVIIANICQANPERIDLYAGTFIIARIFYGIFYIADLAKLRSTVWMIGVAATVGLYYLAYKGA